MKSKKLYLQNWEESGLEDRIAHPDYLAIITEEFYWDCLDEFSPFGNDDGAEALYGLQDWYEETQGKQDIVEYLYNLVDCFGFKYTCESCAPLLDMNAINSIDEEDPHFFRCMDETIVGIAFGQYKIEGKIHPKLKELGLIAIERQRLLSLQMLADNEFDTSKLLKVVSGLSTRPDSEGSTNHLQDIYLERLAIMERDLKKFN